MPRKGYSRTSKNKKTQNLYSRDFFIRELWKPIIIITYCFLLLILCLQLFRFIPLSIHAFQTSKNNIFQVQGTGRVTEIPNSVKFSFGVTKSAATVEDAQKQANDAVNTIVHDLQTASTSANDITIINYTVYPTFDDGKQTPNGYTATQEIEIKISPIRNINQILDFITGNGANQIGGMVFTFDNETQKKLEKKASKQAIADAEQKAQELAKAAGILLGRIIDIQEIPQEQKQLQPVQQPTTQQALDVLNGTSPVPVPSPEIIQAGESIVSVRVILSYETY